MKRTTMLFVVFAVVCAAAGFAQESEPQLPPEDDVSETSSAIDETTLTFDDVSDDTDEAAGGITSFGAGDFIRMLLVLGFVVSMIYALFHILRRASNRNQPRSDLLQVLGSTQLAAGRSLHLVEVGGQVLLVGSSENSVNLISEVTNSETVDELLLQAATRRSSTGSTRARRFGDLLGDLIDRSRGGSSATTVAGSTQPVSMIRTDEDPVDTAGGFYSEQRERLRQL
ncbi:MAG: FliO/MopB family protein [Spirochaetaceae bacterium]